MKCTGNVLLIAFFPLAYCYETVNVTVHRDGHNYSPSRIFAHSHNTIRFRHPSSVLTIVQSTFDKPCTPLHGGFNSACGGGSLKVNEWDLWVGNSSQPLWFFYHSALQPNHCNGGTVGVINPPSTCKYSEFRRIANLHKPNSTRSQATQLACSTATKSNSPISSPTLATQLSQPMTSTTPSPTSSPEQRNVGAIVGGTIAGVVVGIMLLILLANGAFMMYRWRKGNNDPEANPGQSAPKPPPPLVVHTETVLEKEPAAPPGPTDMTQLSLQGDEMHMYQRLPSDDTLLNNAPDVGVTTSPPSSMQDMRASDPAMRRMTIRLSSTLPQMEMLTRPRADAPSTLYLIPSDPFASVGLPLPVPVDSPQDQQPQPQRRPSVRRITPRESRSDSIFQAPQPAIPEQEMEFIAQEVVTFILTDATSVERPESRHIYSSPRAGQSSPNLDHSRRSPTLSYVQRSPTVGYSLPQLSLRRTSSRASSMEGD